MAPAKEFIDYYAVLKVSQTDSFETIKSSYRVLALQLHPDKNPGDPAATQAFQKLNDAWETLKDATKRRDYNQVFFQQTQQTREDRAKAERQEREAKRQKADFLWQAEQERRRKESEEASQRRRKEVDDLMTQASQLCELETHEQAARKARYDIEVLLVKEKSWKRQALEIKRTIHRYEMDLLNLADAENSYSQDEMETKVRENNWARFRIEYFSAQEKDERKIQREYRALQTNANQIQLRLAQESLRVVTAQLEDGQELLALIIARLEDELSKAQIMRNKIAARGGRAREQTSTGGFGASGDFSNLEDF